MRGTLIWSSMDHDRSNVLVLDNTHTSFKLMDKIYAYTGKQSKRLSITKNKYFYAPSEDYKKYIIRFKRTK